MERLPTRYVDEPTREEPLECDDCGDAVLMGWMLRGRNLCAAHADMLATDILESHVATPTEKRQALEVRKVVTEIYAQSIPSKESR